MKNEQAYTQDIINAFERYATSFSDESRLMLLYRIYKLTGNTIHRDELAALSLRFRLMSLENSLPMIQGHKPMLPEIRPARFLRGQWRTALYTQRPELYFADQTLRHIFFLDRLNLLHTPRCQPTTEAILDAYAQIDWSAVYYDKTVIAIDSSYCMNSVITLRELNIDVTLAEKVFALFRQEYLQKEVTDKMSDDEYQSVIYSLTHIIIAESLFYERFVEGYEWIIEYFIEHWDAIVTRTMLDIHLEVALCFRLMRMEEVYPDFFAKILEECEQAIDWPSLQKQDYVIEEFHSLYIAMFLFSEQFTLHPGPDLSQHLLFTN